MPAAIRRPAVIVGVLWFCFLAKLIFYSSFVPLWEGYDEFAHFAFAEHLFHNHSLPDLKGAVVPQEVANSLQTGPVPWTIRSWAGETPLRLYEAQQPPLAYLLYAIPYAAFQRAHLPTRVWIVRITGSLIVSFVIPLGFLLARRIFGSAVRALSAIAIVAAMPELMMTADHGGNEPLAILLGTACVFALVSRRALLLGCLLGLGLLTKAYFLTLIPVVVIVFFRHKRKMLIVFAAALAIAGWWYARAFYVTGSLTGAQIAAAGAKPVSLVHDVTGIDWLRVADFALVSHIWLGGWSFLVVRTWMYRTIELIMLAAGIGIALQLARRRLSEPIAICAGTLLSFIAGMAWYAYATWRATGEAAVLGYYACALIVPEAICLVAGLTTRYLVPAVVACFATIELYGTVFLLMPYYAKITAHTPRGSVPAARIGQIFSAELFRNLAANKPGFLSPGILIALWIVFLAALAAIVAAGFLSAFGQRSET